MAQSITSHTTKGIVIVCLMIGIDLLLQSMHPHLADGDRYLPRLIISFVGVAAAVFLYGRQSRATTFGDLFSHGFKTTTVIAFFMAVYTFTAVKWIYPPPTPEEMEQAVKAKEANGNTLHREAVEQAAQAAQSRWIIYVSLTIFSVLIPGSIGAAGGAALTKKNR